MTSTDLDAIVAFDRSSSGVLTQKPGITGCYTTDSAVATAQSCNLFSPPANSFDGPTGAVVSPNNKNVYVVSSTGRAIVFDRAADGSLALHPGSGAVSNYSSGPLTTVTLSPDGASLYLGGPDSSGAVGWYVVDSTGGLSFANCFGGVCGTAQNLGSINDLKVSPDGKQLLIASSSAVLGWDRSASGAPVGGLTPSSTPARCVASTDLGGTCQARPGIASPQSLSMVDDTRVLFGNQYGFATIARNPTTNALTPETSGNCFAYPTSSFSGCQAIPGSNCCSNFYPARDVLATPDGAFVFLGTEPTNGGIYGFTNGSTINRNTSAFGCVNVGGSDGCAALRQGNQVHAIAVSSDSRTIYGGGGNRLFSFAIDRPPTCSTVDATTQQNMAVDVSLSCSDPDGDPITSYEIVGGPPHGTLGAVNGSSVAYSPLAGTSGTDSFSYRATTAAATSDPATVTVTVTVKSSPPLTQPPKSDAACKKAKSKLKKAKLKLEKLLDKAASKKTLDKAKDKIKQRKKKVKKLCG